MLLGLRDRIEMREREREQVRAGGDSVTAKDVDVGEKPAVDPGLVSDRTAAVRERAALGDERLRDRVGDDPLVLRDVHAAKAALRRLRQAGCAPRQRSDLAVGVEAALPLPRARSVLCGLVERAGLRDLEEGLPRRDSGARRAKSKCGHAALGGGSESVS